MPLMVLIAIVAVIAALAIPAWRNHRITDRLDQAVMASEAAKLVMEAATMRGGLARLKPGDLTDNAQATSSAYTARQQTCSRPLRNCISAPCLVLIGSWSRTA